MALLELIVEHSQIVLACVLAVLVVYLILGGGKSGLPPTIKGWPIIGNMLQVEPDMTKYVMKLSKQLGSDIISLKVGSNVMVFLLKQDMIKEAFAGDELTARPDLYFKRVLTQGNGYAMPCHAMPFFALLARKLTNH
ncbi:cytochrome P450 2L1-like [Tubulanus polymorphus]|uniref:cytochrome P450 2L1-like n=1 Tax=Tubulanus polymorphus TaxID=672921 RepID=UPI003DA6A90C